MYGGHTRQSTHFYTLNYTNDIWKNPSQTYFNLSQRCVGRYHLALPLCGLLKKHIPDIKVSFLGRGYTQPIVAMSQNIDAFVNFDEICKLTDTQLQMFFSGLQIDTAIHLRADKGLAELIQKQELKIELELFIPFIICPLVTNG